jgi:hypothetical protein
MQVRSKVDEIQAGRDRKGRRHVQGIELRIVSETTMSDLRGGSERKWEGVLEYLPMDSGRDLNE